MADFPALRPSSRRVRMGDFPRKKYTSLAGISVTRIFGTQATGWGLELGWRNTTGTNAGLIWDHFMAQKGTRFTLPTLIFSGEGSLSLSTRLRTQLPSIQWEYQEPPDIESVFENIYNVNVVLSGELNYG